MYQMALFTYEESCVVLTWMASIKQVIEQVSTDANADIYSTRSRLQP